MLTVFLTSQATEEQDLYPDREFLAECFGNNVTKETQKKYEFPMQTSLIHREQAIDEYLQRSI